MVGAWRWRCRRRVEDKGAICRLQVFPSIRMFPPEASVSLRRKCVHYLIGVRIPPTSPRKRQFFLTGVSTSELRRLFMTLDLRLEIPVKTRELILRLLVPAERRAHQKGQRAREVFRLGQSRRSRVRLARFEAERVLPDKETVQRPPPAEFPA